MRIAIVGPGRLGRSLERLWRDAGHTTHASGREQDLLSRPEIVMIAVPDAAIADVARALPPGPVVLHASGATGLEALGTHTHRGSLHPLMSFPGPEVAMPDLRGVPAAVDGATEETRTVAETLAQDLGMRPIAVPGDRRLYHASAVMAGNFATVLLAEAGRALEAAGVPAHTARELLAPLAIASIRQSVASPREGLTGPIARGDDAVLRAHREALQEHGLAGLASLHRDLADRAAHLLEEPDEGTDLA